MDTAMLDELIERQERVVRRGQEVFLRGDLVLAHGDAHQMSHHLYRQTDKLVSLYRLRHGER